MAAWQPKTSSHPCHRELWRQAKSGGGAGRVRWIQNFVICSGWRLRSISAVNKVLLSEVGFQFDISEEEGRRKTLFYSIVCGPFPSQGQTLNNIPISGVCGLDMDLVLHLANFVIYCRNGWVDLHHNNDLLLRGTCIVRFRAFVRYKSEQTLVGRAA